MKLKKNVMKSNKVLGFEKTEMEAMVESLNLLLANLHVHYQKLRNYHWNVTGGEFFEIHELTEVEYNQVLTEIDDVAERIRVFGAYPMSTLKEYLSKSEIKETKVKHNAKEIVKEILDDFGVLISLMIDTIELTQDMGDVSTNEMLTGFMKRREKMHWMLNAFITE